VKLALTTSEETLDAPLDPRFGRAPRFLVLDTDTAAFEIVETGAASADDVRRLWEELRAALRRTGRCDAAPRDREGAVDDHGRAAAEGP
jgi:hypothetical protein